MKTVTIAETKSGFIVVSGELAYTEKPHEIFARSHSFNSLEKAVSHIRNTLKAWNKTEASPLPRVQK